ncbi:MAG: DoxX family protein [Verrucomicrobiota bacterium]|jgi:putative oxidoreductase
MLKKIFAPGNNSDAVNAGLLALRVWVGLAMLVNHGVDKLKHFSDTAPNFPDPLGIGHPASLALVVFAEFFVSLFVIFGLVTRWSALVLAIDMGVAFIGIHKGALSGQGSGELAFMYLMGYVTLLLAGPGRFSVDKALFGKGGSSQSK